MSIHNFTPMNFIQKYTPNRISATVVLATFCTYIMSPITVTFAAVPTVNLTYTKNPANAGLITITATYSEPVDAGPMITIDQPGSTDDTNIMTDS